MTTNPDHPRMIRLRTTDELAAGFGTQDENREFRLAVTEAALTGKGTVVFGQDGEILAVILAAATTRAREVIEDVMAEPDEDTVSRLAQLLAQIVLAADNNLLMAVDEFLPNFQPGETLAERIERYLRHDQ